MTVESWKEEFYPIEADRCPKEEAIQHSLRKWSGLTENNLLKHEVKVDGARAIAGGAYVLPMNANGLRGNHYVEIDSRSCSLCHHYNQGDCSACPITFYKQSEKMDTNQWEQCSTEYLHWRRVKDPHPMIELLKNTLAFMEKK